MPATLREVAEKARVSVGTVSRVLNGHPSVSPENLRRVREAAQQLNYKPLRKSSGNGADFSLRGKNVLLMLLGMDRSLETLPVVASAIHGVEAAVSEAQANLLFADVPHLERFPHVLDRNRIDGLILKGALQGDLVQAADPALLERIRTIPAVWFLGRPQGFRGDVVQVNDDLVGWLAAEHLVSRGHRRLAFLSPKPSQVTLMRREASFAYHARRAGAEVRSYLGSEEGWTLPLSAVNSVGLVSDLVSRLLGERQRPTAVFAPDDSIGVTICRALAERGLRAGRDLSVIACNNDRPLLGGLHPELTTIDVHADRIGRRAADQLAWRLAHRDEPAWDIGIEPALVEGASVARL